MSIWCRETGERVTGAGQLLQPLNQDRWRSLLGSSELASKVMLPATTISVGGGRRVNGSGGLVALIPYCLLWKCLGFDKSTLTHKILFIYKVHDITVLPLLLITIYIYIEIDCTWNFIVYKTQQLYDSVTIACIREIINPEVSVFHFQTLPHPLSGSWKLSLSLFFF